MRCRKQLAFSMSPCSKIPGEGMTSVVLQRSGAKSARILACDFADCVNRCCALAVYSCSNARVRDRVAIRAHLRQILATALFHVGITRKCGKSCKEMAQVHGKSTHLSHFLAGFCALARNSNMKARMKVSGLPCGAVPWLRGGSYGAVTGPSGVSCGSMRRCNPCGAAPWKRVESRGAAPWLRSSSRGVDLTACRRERRAPTFRVRNVRR